MGMRTLDIVTSARGDGWHSDAAKVRSPSVTCKHSADFLRVHLRAAERSEAQCRPRPPANQRTAPRPCGWGQEWQPALILRPCLCGSLLPAPSGLLPPSPSFCRDHVERLPNCPPFVPAPPRPLPPFLPAPPAISPRSCPPRPPPPAASHASPCRVPPVGDRIVTTFLLVSIRLLWVGMCTAYVLSTPPVTFKRLRRHAK